MPRLSVVIDGKEMPEADARAFWKRFSDHMEANKGDLAGFAKAEGFASVKPTMSAQGPELVVSKTAAQTPYKKAEHGRSNDGLTKPQSGAPNRSRNRGKPGRS
jgi:hypothetical protein